MGNVRRERPLLNPAAITAFLDRKLASYEWLKDCSEPELNQALADYLPKADLSQLKLWLHQKVALTLLADLKRFMLHMDMGSGKTLVTLALIQALKQSGYRPKAIVFVPYITSVMTWVDEVRERTPNLVCVPLVSDTQTNLRQLCGTEADLFVICYQSAVAMVSNRDGGKWRLSAPQVREYFKGCNVLVMDEIHKCSDVSTLTYRMCMAISRQAEYALGLTGTPFGRNLEDLWPQFSLIDFGQALGPSLGFYREVFFTAKRKFWGGGQEYKFRKKLLPDLTRIIKSRSIHYGINDLIDLPPTQHVPPIHLPCPDVAKGYCDDALTALREGIKHKEIELVTSNYMQLRQLSSGFMTVTGTERVQIEFEDNPKLDALVGLVEAMSPGCKMVVFHHFIYTNAMISKRLKKLKVGHARVWGGQKNNLAELQRFKGDPSCTVLVLNDRSGSSSLNLQHANYCVFFEQPDSPIDRQQGERRVWRPGQTKRVLYYDLLVDGTVDGRIHAANLAGKNLLQELLKGGTL